MSKISGQLLTSGQFQDNCEISGQLGSLSSHVAKNLPASWLHLFQGSYKETGEMDFGFR